MTKMQSRKIARGVGIGLAVAGTAAAVGGLVWGSGNKRRVKSKARQFARTVGHIVDNVQRVVQ
ncbi:MAG: hypothetical protein FWG82_00480 [Oscillospiraceae bacterium]|nr:hypothetical protein [Oscillospiraceae bacterium]